MKIDIYTFLLFYYLRDLFKVLESWELELFIRYKYLTILNKYDVWIEQKEFLTKSGVRALNFT